MHNTRSAISSLINRYKSILKKCHLLNTFGSLTVAASLVVSAFAVSGVGNAELVHAADSGTTTGTDAIITNYLSNYGTSTNKTTINIDGDAYSINYRDKDGNSKIIKFDATNALSKNIRETVISVVDGANQDFSYIKNFVGSTNSVVQSGPYAQYNGGALSIVNDQKHAVNNNVTTITIPEITGDFIGNSISSNNSTIYQGNGGAIALFSNHKAQINVTQITGDFISNSVSRVGGAIYLFTNNGSTSQVGVINGDFIGNAADLGGGAIANYEGFIGEIDGTFIGNVAKTGGGGAIDNMMWSLVGGHKATITSIKGDFIGNTAGTDEKNKEKVGDGGAIRNLAYSYGKEAKEAGFARIETITSNFIGNIATQNGGAIYNCSYSSYDNPDVKNEATITSILGDFIGNAAGGNGGAIYNGDSYASTAEIGSINGNFIENTSGVFGGAIYNTSKIGDINDKNLVAIKGNFINNAINGGNVAIGGAVYNFANGKDASIGTIAGDFIGNSANAKLALGGAIANYAGVVGTTAKIGNITGDFIGNTATRYGGAIYNDSFGPNSAQIGTISGDFLKNSVTEKTNSDSDDATAKAQGGAIYNNDTIGIVSGSFIGNYAHGTSTNVDVKGGAIYTTADMNFDANDQTNYFSDNYIKDQTKEDYNVIYVDIDNIIHDAPRKDINLNFTMSGSGNVVMNDSISGNKEYTPLTNTDYITIAGEKATNSVSATGSSLTIAYQSTNPDKHGGSAAVSGTLLTTGKVVTKTFEVGPTGGNGNTTTTTVTTATTVYNNGQEGDTTYSSVITVVDSDNNIVSVTTSTEAKDLTGGTTTTTYEIKSTSKNGESASYTETKDKNGKITITSAKVVTVDVDDTITTTTYTDSNGDKAVLVSDADKPNPMTGDTAYDITISGRGTNNIFYLNDEVTNFGDFNISNATLYLSQYTHANGTVTKGTLSALDSLSSVTFGENSQLTIDMSAYPSSMMYGGAIGEAVLKGNGATLKIDDSAKLHLINAHTGDTFTILSGFTVKDGADIQQGAGGNYAAWAIENVTMDSSLQKVTIVRDGYNDTKDTVVEGSAVTSMNTGITPSTILVQQQPVPNDIYYALSIEANTESPLANSSVGNIVISAATDANFGYDSDIAGERYLYDVSTIKGDREQVAAIEGTASIAKTSGVPTTTYRINRLSSDALSTRLNGSGDTGSVLTTSGDNSGLGELSKKYESTALWFVPMYGHDMTDGASLAGFDADFHTNIYGGVVGVDKTVDNEAALGLAADLYRVGIALNMGAGNTSASGDFNGIDNTFNFGGAFVYGVAEYGNLTLSADAGFNKIMSEVNQDLSHHGIAGTKADVNSFAWSADLQAQYRFEGDTVDIVPYAGLEFVSMKTDDYNVMRADAAGGTVFTVASDRQNIISMPVGVKFDGQWAAFDDWLLTPQVSVGVIFAMGDLDEHSSITMPHVAGTGHTSMQVVDEITFDMSTGLSIANDVWTFGLDYELQMSEHRTGHALVGLVQYKF